jgi:competence protein ComEA
MEPSPTPPWRVLEAPTAEQPSRASVRTEPPAGDGLPAAVKGGAALAAALVCAAVALVVAVGGGGGSVRIDGGSPLPLGGGSPPPGSSAASIGGELVVEIVGAVPRPGVYRLPPGSRLVDLLQMAGGYGPRVDTARAEQELNLAAPVKDGDHIRVPSRDDRPAPGSAAPVAGSGQPGVTTLLDINTATQAQLEELPGVGPATAQKIIAAREEAPFGAVEELRSRGVLGEKTYEKLRPLVTVG